MKLKKLILFAVVGLFLMPYSWGGADTPVIEPDGYYLLQGRDLFGTVPNQKLRNAKIDGLSIRFSWALTEPVKGIYDWTGIDAEIARANGLGKDVMLRPMAGAHAPRWLYDEGAKSARSKKGKKMPRPWDPVMLENWVAFISILGARYPDVALVHMGGPVADTSEMHLPDALLQNYPNAIEKVFDAWVVSIDAFDSAFPETALALNVSNPFNGRDGLARRVSEQAVAVLGERASLQNNSLHAGTSPGFAIIELLAEENDEGVRVGFQMLCPSSKTRFDGTLAAALAIGDSIGAGYYEVYPGDVKFLP